MINGNFEAEWDTLDGARQQIKEQLDNLGLWVFNETVESDGRPKTVKGTGDSYPTAISSARSKVPRNAHVLEEKEVVSPSEKSLEIEAPDEASARKKVGHQLYNDAYIERITTKSERKNGILGIGKKDPVYKIDIIQPSVAEIKYAMKARIKVEAGEMPSSGYCQRCGKAGSSARTSEKSINYFCSSSCEESYFKVSLANVLSNRMVFNMTGQDISSTLDGVRRTGNMPTYCWACGHKLSASDTTCHCCNKSQEIRRF
jgi:hypothetical protein